MKCEMFEIIVREKKYLRSYKKGAYKNNERFHERVT